LLKKVTFPALNASAGLIKLSELPFSYATISFVKTLLEKRYSLPERVLHSVR
jgi:hypothetical protein